MNRSERRAVLQRYRQRPDLFAVEILGFQPWSKQVEILNSVRDHTRTAVRSCHGVGKTAVAAVVVLWFLYCYPNSRVVTTAPIFKQVRELLWREIRARFAAAELNGTPLGGKINTTDLNVDKEWFAVGLSTNDPIAFQGHHAENMLFVADEASGVAQEIYDAAEGFLTSDHARVLLIGNPNQTSGQFYDCFTKQKRMWNCIAISAFDSPNFTGETMPDNILRRLVNKRYEADAKQKWGNTSPLYQVRVLGQFPSTADNTVLSLSDLELAQQRRYKPIRGAKGQTSDPVVIACDVARFGTDETVIGIRTGWKYRQVKSYTKKAVTETAGILLDIADSWEKQNPDLPIAYIVVDDSGVGGGVTDLLEEDGRFDVRAYNAAHKPRDKKHYPNTRSESWFYLAEHIDRIDLDKDQQLLADLVAPTYKLDSKGRRVVEEKAITKQRLKRSPDRADACLMAFYPVKDRTTIHTPESLYR